ncbi:MAG: tetratricopeptide repeat protein [Desulfamplus sp.]|nr:tetratricopeptide repeat protein [Desulfamplus sp.]
MTLITIKEKSTEQSKEKSIESGTINAIVSLNHGPGTLVALKNPFSDDEEKTLAWYFEEHLRTPYFKEVTAKEAAQSIKEYGERLFEQIFDKSNADLWLSYQQARQQGLNTLQFEIIGSPEFQQLHWEALREPGRNPFVLHGTMIRRGQVSQTKSFKVQESPFINLLVVTARPHGRRDVGYRTISRPLIDALRNINAPVNIDLVRPGTYQALMKHLEASRDQHGVGYYHIIHFDLHGSILTHQQLKQIGKLSDVEYQSFKVMLEDRYGRDNLEAPNNDSDSLQAYLFFETDDEEKIDAARADELAQLLQEYQIPIAILNACQSGKQIGEQETSLGSRLLQAGIQNVIAMGYSVTVSAAELMMKTLYPKLLSEKDLLKALCHARYELHNQKKRRAYFNYQIQLEDWLLPVLYQPQGLSALSLPLRPMTDNEQAEFGTKLKSYFQSPEPTYGFFGRDIDILQIEKRLLAVVQGRRKNLLLVHGMGGAGKTTLLCHLGAWWQRTGLVQNVFYFGYDKKAYTAEQIMMEIAQCLYNQDIPQGRTVSPAFSNFQSKEFALQQQQLSQDLRSKRHLLILDNLESITGQELAIPNTLPKAEQEKFRNFLVELKDGLTLVLLGSRSEERWLEQAGSTGSAPLRKNDRYELTGLDTEAASRLAEHILTEQVPDKSIQKRYRESEAFRELLKMLAGYPLPLEVVLSNLGHSAPEAVLKALQSGDEQIDPRAKDNSTEARTRSIIRCIEYSHSNLDESAQKMLLCLFPFTGVVWQKLLPEYFKLLQQQPALSGIPFERASEVIQTAQNWGLVSPHAIPGFLTLQPIFPYFLKTRLAVLDNPDFKTAVETAFRQHYDLIGMALHGFLTAQNAQEKQIGQMLIPLESSNLYTALNFALQQKVSIWGIYTALDEYLTLRQDHQKGIDLGKMILEQSKQYSPEQLTHAGMDFVRVLGDLGRRELDLKQYQKAESRYKEALHRLEALAILDKEFKAKMIAVTYHQLGCVAHQQRKFQQAEEAFQKALQIYIEFNARYEQAKTYHQLGIVAQEQRKFQQAEEAFQKALKIKIEFNDRYSQAYTYHQLGIVAQEQRKFQQAEEAFQKALEIKIEFNDRYSQASTYHQLGIVAEEQRKFQQAEEAFQKALEIKIELNARYEQAKTYHQLGIVAQEQRKFQQAEEAFQKALEIFIEFNARYEQASTYHQLGRVAEEQGKLQQAEEYFLQALKILKEFEDAHGIQITLRSLARLGKRGYSDSFLSKIGAVLEISAKEVEELLKQIQEDLEG